ncbi:helix-turn-helix domain-containing protein [Limnoraphis robusta]|uniref:DNA-binding protein n=1 Tax=Limnoraphis robusta CS-951 TaxID=1637645 RepID=A0A0F5YP02_9CYAN|nr:helix-turn-helix transcriptional regulator [Limnoraphis robusta]KKD39925.1 DNA-binding protein [Limnoraphis robusta CS-951]KMW70077.1 DNA-binding protein [Limnoraphis robusta CS-951]
MNHQPRKKLGSNIRQLRIKQGLSQEQLAEKADLHRTYVGAIERGERNVSLDNIVALAHALGVSASKLLEGVD